MESKDLALAEDKLFCAVVAQWGWVEKGTLQECLSRAKQASGQGKTARVADVIRESGHLTPERIQSAWDTLGQSYVVCRACGKALPHFNAPAPGACTGCGSTDLGPAGQAVPGEEEEAAKGEGVLLEDTGETLLQTDGSGSGILPPEGDAPQAGEKTLDESPAMMEEQAQTLLHTDGSGSSVLPPEQAAPGGQAATLDESPADMEGDAQTLLKVSSSEKVGKKEAPAGGAPPGKPSSETDMGGKTGATWPAEKGKPKETAVRTEGGKQFFGNYEIVKELSRGGMGIVYIAKQRGLSREVALKVLIAGEGATEDQIKRFHREAESSAKMSHPNIVPIFDVGVVGNQHYFTMEFVKGKPLDALIKEQAVEQEEALRIIAKTARALHYAHEQDIIHRDIKPGNILLTEEGEPKLTDFGLAKDVGGGEGQTLTVSGAVMGTPRYMSPEQAEGRTSEIDSRSDLFSLGSIFYELLTDQTPFTGNTIVELLKKVSQEDPPPPRRLNKHIHKDVETICLKCLEKDVSKRYQNGDALADDIDRFIAGDPILAKPVGLTTKVYKKARKYRGIVITGLIALVLLLGAGGVFLFLQMQKEGKRKEQFQTAMKDGKEAFEKGSFKAAEEFFLTAVNLEEGNAEAKDWHEKAAEALQKKLDAEKKAEAQRARKEEAERLWREKFEKFKAKILEAREAADAKDFDKAEKAIEVAFGLDPPDPEDREKVEALKETIRKEKEAWQEQERKRHIAERLETARELEADAEAVLETGDLEAATVAFEKAGDAFGEVLDADPGNEEAERSIREISVEKIGRSYLNLEKFDLARKAVQDLPGDLPAVKAFLEEVDRKKRTAGVFRDLLKKAREAIASKEWDAALSLLNQASQRARTPELETLLVQARVGAFEKEAGEARAAHRWEEAVGILEKALAIAPEGAKKRLETTLSAVRREGHDDLLEQAGARFRGGKLREARPLAERAVALSPTEPAKTLLEQIDLALDKPEGMVFIKGASFPVGSTVAEESNPARTVRLDSFYIDVDEVTNREFLEFIEAGGYEKESYWDPEGWKIIGRFKTQAGGSGGASAPGPASWVGGKPKELEIDNPVTGVSWYEARAYARYRGKRLPTAAEWEIAASYDPASGERRKYPWGDRFDKDNPMLFGNLQSRGPWTAKISARKDVSPVGCREMAGNVMEWTVWKEGKKERGAIKGGCFRSSAPEFDARATTARKPGNVAIRPAFLGFRLAQTAGG